MSGKLSKFLKCVMHNEYKHDDDGCHSKYSNTEYDIIIQKRRSKIGELVIESCIVIDKRGKPIIYNDLEIAIQRICKV